MKRDIRKKLIISVILLTMCTALLVGCGGSAPDEEEKGPDTSFLIGIWIAKTVTQGDVTMDAIDAFQGDGFTLLFEDDGECQMGRANQYAMVDWTMNEDGSLTLKGDNTYEVTFPDDSKKTLIFTINDMDVMMEKYEE